MKVGLETQQSSFKNIHAINRSIAARNGNRVSGQLSKAERRDSVTISPGGKRNSLLEGLMKQKANINEQKNSLISLTLEKGGTLETIKAQLENYDEQMKNVDDQIAEMMAKELEKQAEELKKDSKPKTEEEIQNERLANITNLSSDLQQAQVISSAQAKVDGSARVLRSEIELDRSRTSIEGAREIIDNKEKGLAVMEKKSLNLTSQISDKLSDVAEKINDISKPQETAPSEESESKAEEVDLANKPSSDVAQSEQAEKAVPLEGN